MIDAITRQHTSVHHSIFLRLHQGEVQPLALLFNLHGRNEQQCYSPVHH